MNRKSSVRTSQFRPGSSQSAAILSTFRQQMADHARGELLRELREQRHLSQEDAAHEIGVSTRTLREWEKGGKIKWPNAKRAAGVYEVEPESLVSRELEGVALNGDGPLAAPQLQEQLDEINRKLDELLRRTAPTAPAQPDREPAGDDEIPTDLPGEQGSPPESPSEDEGDSEQAG